MMEISLLAKNLMEPDTDKIHNEEIRKAYVEINKNGGGDMEKPFYTQFEKLRNKIKDKDKKIQDKDEVIQRQSEELLILQEQLSKANKALEENNIALS